MMPKTLSHLSALLSRHHLPEGGDDEDEEDAAAAGPAMDRHAAAALSMSATGESRAGRASMCMATGIPGAGAAL